MASSASTSILLIFPCFLLFQAFHSLSMTTARTTATTTTTTTTTPTTKRDKPLVLPLRTQKVASLSLPSPPNKLLFHHNVSLTITLSVGSPPQNVSLVLDTGSELSWLLCDSKTSPSFRPRASSSYSPIPCSSPTCRSQTRDLPIPASCDASRLCHVALSYADASSSEGTLAADLFSLGASPPLRTAFGCMAASYSSAAGDPAAAGMLGMNRGSLSFVSQTNTRRFSYCISDRDSSGVLLLGHAALSFLPLNYTPLVDISLPLPYFDRVAYSVQLEGIRVGTVLLPIPKSVLVPDHTGAGQTMVDSGTQFTFLLGAAYDALKIEFLRQTKGVLTPLDEPSFVFQGAFDACFRVPERRPLPRVPAVVLMFRGAEVEVSGERLLYRVAGEVRGGDGVWCLTFGNSDLVPLSAFVIGHHHQQNVWVEYDLENGRLGFAPVRCDLASQRLGVVL
ncbi:aspartic proteinase PCS1-like [Phoenix dactylifera]|uniref:Aspartic proteinase PCS1-like n=1 Tax=Phoenix dactylifera TaxID=42345 RepID=A0A8B7BI43_PHODC|nr:aspartic proteinase PCS1-like [Phoenix dactylifera]